MSSNDASLSQALNQLSKATDIGLNDEVAEVARVKKARADVTEHARKSGDNAGKLLSNLLGESNAEIEAEEERKLQKVREAEARQRAEQEAAEEKKRREATSKLAEEKRRLEEKEQRRLQMLADLEKKRRLEAGEVDEEEEAQKRQQAEQEARRKAAEEAREHDEQFKLKSLILENQVKLDLMKPKPVDPEVLRREKLKKRIIIGSAAAAVVLAIGGGLGYYFATLKAPDFYKLSPSYESTTLALTAIPSAGFETQVLALQHVVQEAPKSDTGPTRPRPGTRPVQQTQQTNRPSAADIIGGNTITF
ncbi:MAG: hypothetical protein FWC40_08645 [Proteobacteria bacterium]|nr:hypothetical protein [Pseudomonadota bacterium]